MATESLKKTSRSNVAHVQSSRPFCPAAVSQCYRCSGKHIQLVSVGIKKQPAIIAIRKAT